MLTPWVDSKWLSLGRGLRTPLLQGGREGESGARTGCCTWWLVGTGCVWGVGVQTGSWPPCCPDLQEGTALSLAFDYRKEHPSNFRGGTGCGRETGRAAPRLALLHGDTACQGCTGGPAGLSSAPRGFGQLPEEEEAYGHLVAERRGALGREQRASRGHGHCGVSDYSLKKFFQLR